MGQNEERNVEQHKIVISVNAQTNIFEIANYINTTTLAPLTAIKIVDKIYTKIESIKTNPFAFKECEPLKTTNKIYRQARCYKWLIVYKTLKNKIIVLGVIHGSRNPALLKNFKKIK